MNIKLKLKASRAKQQALITNERGQAVEALAKKLQKRLQKRNQIVTDYSYELEEYALVMQYQAQHSLMYVSLQNQGSYSTDLSIAASQAHVQAIKAQVQAIKLYCQAVTAYTRFNNCGKC